MASWGIEAEIIEFQKSDCTSARHDELMKEIRDRMRRISDAQSSESGDEQDGDIPLVQVDGGV